MKDLIARLEAATGPDRELDEEIDVIQLGVCMVDANPRYTASIDAAMTLIPAGWYWSISQDEVCLTNPCGRFLVAGDTEIYVHNKPAAIALCIAALKARLP